MSALPDWSYSDIEEMLNYIDPSCARDDWVRIGMSIYDYFGPDGLNLFLDWSSKGSNYNRKDAVATYNSFSRHGGISIGSLVKAAKENGWTFSKERTQPTEEELKLRAEWRLKREAQIKQQQEAKMAEQSQKAVKAGELIARLPALAEHHYLDYKQVKAYSLKDYNGSVCMPIYDIKNDKVISYQTITETVTPDGDTGFEKRMMRGARKKGGYFYIPSGTLRCSDFFYVAEGYATAATIHEVTEKPVVVCMDCGNIETVVEGLKTRCPDADIVICADNDWHSEKNPGLTEARKVQQVYHSDITYPYFTSQQIEDFKSREIKPTDFNDLKTVLNFSDEQIKTMLDTVEVYQKPEIDYDNIEMFPDKKKGGKVLKGTRENLETMLHLLGWSVKYNECTKKLEINTGNDFSTTNNLDCNEAEIISAANKFDLPTGNIHDFLINIGDRNRYNPFADYITSKPWDGIPRVKDFIHTLHIKEENQIYITYADGTKQSFYDMLILRWFYGAVTAPFCSKYGFSMQGCLVLQGKQGIGKSRWGKHLVPKEFVEKGIYKEGLTIREGNKDDIKAAISCAIGELGELDGIIKKTEVTSLKNFLTLQRDELRSPYGKYEKSMPRQAVYLATVNSDGFLRDDENRRFWIVPVESIDNDSEFDMQQVWAELHYYVTHNPGAVYLTNEEKEILFDNNQKFEVSTQIEDLINSLPWDTTPKDQWYAMTVYQALLMVGANLNDKSIQIQAGILIKRRNGNMKLGPIGKSRIRLVAVPAKPSWINSGGLKIDGQQIELWKNVAARVGKTR